MPLNLIVVTKAVSPFVIGVSTVGKCYGLRMRLSVDRSIFFIINAWIYIAYPRLIIRYIRFVRRLPNIARPSHSSELMQWRKIFDRNPVFCTFSDKLLAKNWVSERCSSLKIPWPLWVGADPSEIPDQFLLPGFVIKTNHATNQNYFSQNSGNRQEIETLFREYLSVSLAKGDYCEWSYVAVDKKIFVEKYISNHMPLMDISVRAHNGQISLVSIAIYYKTPKSRIAYFYPDGSRYQDDSNRSSKVDSSLSPQFRIPENFHEAVTYARILSVDIDYVRVDFLSTGEELYFSELTVYPASGYARDVAHSKIVFDSWLKQIRCSWFFRQEYGYLKKRYQLALLRHFSNLSQHTD